MEGGARSICRLLLREMNERRRTRLEWTEQRKRVRRKRGNVLHESEMMQRESSEGEERREKQKQEQEIEKRPFPS